MQEYFQHQLELISYFLKKEDIGWEVQRKVWILGETLGDEYNQNVSYEILEARIEMF